MSFMYHKILLLKKDRGTVPCAKSYTITHPLQSRICQTFFNITCMPLTKGLKQAKVIDGIYLNQEPIIDIFQGIFFVTFKKIFCMKTFGASSE